MDSLLNLQEGNASSSADARLQLVSAEAELLDPTPDLHSTFQHFDVQFFGGLLSGCAVEWSKRLTSCAGICYYRPSIGYCVIRMSEPLLKLRPRKDFIETLLHEMIHAYLFVTQRNTDRDGHGPVFQSHMHRINQIAGTNVSIYHTFHDEVHHYKKHWWRCEGPCKARPPFYGYVKRSMNRAPSKADIWWAAHQQTCGGKFIKIKEPDATEATKKTQPKVSNGKISKNSPQPKNNTSILSFITTTPSKSQNKKQQNVIVIDDDDTLPSGGATMLNNLWDQPSTSKAVFSSIPQKSFVLFGGKGMTIGNSNPPASTSPQKGIMDYVKCPSCPQRIPLAEINSHLDLCLN